MREGEVLGLTWDSIDFDKGVITISKQLQKERGGSGEYHLVSPKNGKGRKITPATAVIELLKRHRTAQLRRQLRADPLWEDSGLVFTDEIGHHMSAQTVYLNFKKLAAAIGHPDARFHDLRHPYVKPTTQNFRGIFEKIWSTQTTDYCSEQKSFIFQTISS